MWIVFLYVPGFCLCARVKGKTWHVSQQELTGIGKEQQVRTIGEAVSLVEPAASLAIKMHCYPRGEVPGVELGTYHQYRSERLE